MFKTHVSARKVLILDPELRNTPIPSDLDEAFLIVSVSGWIRRLWTLREIVLGRRLQVRFQDGFFDLIAEYERPKSFSKDGLNFEQFASSSNSDC